MIIAFITRCHHATNDVLDRYTIRMRDSPRPVARKPINAW